MDIIERKETKELILQSKHDYEDIFNAITDMITIHDKDFNIIRANKAAEKILKLPFLENVSDTKCFRYYHGTERPPEGCPSCQCLKTGKPATFELFEPHLNMSIEIRVIPRFDSNKQVVGLIHIARYITERKKMEKEHNKLLAIVTRAKREWEMTFDNALEFILLIDEELNITRCNKSFADFVGMPFHELLGYKCYEFFPCNPEQIKYCKDHVETERLTEWTEAKLETGQCLYVSHRPIFDEKGDFLYSILIATDITPLENARQRLMESERELKKRVEDLEKFYEMAVDRELKMKELKKEIKGLKAELSRYKNG